MFLNTKTPSLKVYFFREKRLVFSSVEKIEHDIESEEDGEDGIVLSEGYFMQHAIGALDHYLNDNGKLGAQLFPLDEDQSGEHLKQKKVKDIAEKLNIVFNRGKLKRLLEEESNEHERALLIRELGYEIAESICNTMNLENEANRDSLTKLPNTRAFNERLKEAIAQHDRNNHPFCVLMIDLDRFKEVNDKCGHPAGNEALIEIAKRFNGLMREYDFVARYGGDEFVMLLPDTRPDAACAVAFRIIEEISKSITVRNGSIHEVEVGATIGVGEFHGKKLDSKGEDMIMSADNSLLHLKNNDRRGNVAYQEREIRPNELSQMIRTSVTIEKAPAEKTPKRRGKIFSLFGT